MSDLIRRTAEALARQSQTRRTFLGRVAKVSFATLVSLAASIPMAQVAEASGCNFPGGLCYGNCNSDGTCGSHCSPDLSVWGSSGGCWQTCCPAKICCDCICNGDSCGCSGSGTAPIRRALPLVSYEQAGQRYASAHR